MNVVEKIIEQNKKNPEKIALIEKDLKITYKQLFEDVLNSANNLKKAGFKKGDRIVLFVPMSYSLYKIMLGIFYIGAVVVFIDAWAGKKLILDAIKIAEPKGFIGIFKSHLLNLFSKDVRNIPIKLFPKKILKNSASINFFEYEKMQKTDSALITFTSGSSGKPKAANRSHEFLLIQNEILSKYMQPSKDAVDLTLLPVFFLNNLANGITSVFAEINPATPSKFEPKKIVNFIKQHNITTITGSPSFFEKISTYIIENNEKLDIKKMFIGGAPVFPKLAKKIKNSFPNTETNVIYGSTEVIPISMTKIEEIPLKSNKMGLFVGKPIEEISLQLIEPTEKPIKLSKNDTVNSLKISKNENGEIVVFAKHCLKNYFNSPEAFEKNKIVENEKIWHRTGDVGNLNENGELFLTGKKNNVLIIKNKKFYPFIIEQEIINIKEIKYSSLVNLNKKIFVAIELEKDVFHIEKIKKKIAQIMKNFEINLYEISVVKKIPRDLRHNSKVDLEKLKTLLSNHSKSF